MPHTYLRRSYIHNISGTDIWSMAEVYNNNICTSVCLLSISPSIPSIHGVFCSAEVDPLLVTLHVGLLFSLFTFPRVQSRSSTKYKGSPVPLSLFNLINILYLYIIFEWVRERERKEEWGILLSLHHNIILLPIHIPCLRSQI